jgi:glycosyltransferase involved in cell wall biosynthesis
MAIPLALDLTGLFLAPISRTPRGIDRVELAFARHFLNRRSGACWATLPTPWGVRCFERRRALRLLRAVEKLWRENIDVRDDRAYADTKRRILTTRVECSLPKRPRNLSIGAIVGRYFHLLSITGFTFGHSAARALPKNAIYLNVGQLQIFRPWFWWLLRRPDIRSVFMIHDVTPIELPSHHLPIIVDLHRRIVRNTAEFANAVIFPSSAARDAVCTELRKYSGKEFIAHVELLPVPDEFLGKAMPDAQLSNSPYFVICGAIDPHKNHLFLLEVWKDLVMRLGQKSPKLVIVGSTQVASQAIFEFLHADTALLEHVIVASGVSTPSVKQLIVSARALLMPSMSEGFGLPIVEALAQGTPVIASDIPAHREAGIGGAVTYLPLNDHTSWARSIESLAHSVMRGPMSYRPKTWEQYFSNVEGFLARLMAN